MKKEKGIISIGVLLYAAFLCIAVLTFQKTNETVEKGYLASEGNAAQNFAVLTAASIHLSNDEVTMLKGLSSADLQASAQNQALKELISNPQFTSKVDYAYVMVQLPKEEVKYEVTKDNQKWFDAEIGTPLDILWLLDVTVADAQADVKEDVLRYSYYIEEDKKIFRDAPLYILHSSEWGDHICGYAPLYSNEGDYIGVVGVELETKDYDTYRKSAMGALAMLLVIATLTLTLIFAFLYTKYRKLQYDKIYIDALTGSYNRSYYNNRLVKHLNQTRKEGYCVALLIADIDWFKKINDTFGHDVGDQALIEISNILAETFGKENVVRFGGEEFVVGIWIKKEAELKLRLSALYKRISSTKFGHQQIELSISIGGSYLYCHEVSGWVISSMLKAADYKLYEAKERGRRQFLLTEFDAQKQYKK